MGSGLKYGEFEFPADRGFTGSAGKSNVKGYMRGGKVKGRNTPNKTPKRAKGTTAAAMGGSIGDPAGQQKMGYAGNEREISVDGVNISVPRAKGGRMRKKTTSMHDKLMKEGGKMGYKTGGAVRVRRSTGNTPDDIGREKYDSSPKDKNTSGRFKQKRAKQKTRDSGVVPANKGSTSQEREAGGRGRLKPGFAVGGLAKAASAGARVAGRAVGKAAKAAKRAAGSGAGRGYGERKPHQTVGTIKDTSTRRATRARNPDHTKGKGRSRKGMPKNVKAKGGKVGYYKGGSVSSVGSGGAHQRMPATVKKRGGRVSKKC